ncbi:unnamed protein product [Spirodela intermedia]|uniref:Uncharacterized protein n=1 Tax=Spirodela intermedia TaxID=51605 RepID=A0A7I8KLH7_SPIIN|nr:unnamed protein product [Spirodela intermedia]
MKASMGTEYGDIFDQMFQYPRTPVEFKLPDWLMKKKMVPYTYIKRNVYLFKKTKMRVDNDGIFCSCSSSPGSTICGRDCLCGALLSSCSQNCNCGGKCLNKPFQHRPVKKMKLVQTEKCGSGIIANEDIKQGEFVIEYVGEVIDDKTCEDRLWQMKHRGETNFYLCEINRDMVIDATFKGNKSRYINHSCKPNTEMQKWIINGETRIGIFAIRNIKKGEDLTYDYQFVQFGADQDCHCGAIGCRRKLGNKPSKLKPSSSDATVQLVQLGGFLHFLICFVHENNFIWFVFSSHCMLLAGNSHMSSSHGIPAPFLNCINAVIKVWCSRSRRYYGGVISEFDSQSRKHTILTEDGQYKALDLSVEDWDLL